MTIKSWFTSRVTTHRCLRQSIVCCKTTSNSVNGHQFHYRFQLESMIFLFCCMADHQPATIECLIFLCNILRLTLVVISKTSHPKTDDPSPPEPNWLGHSYLIRKKNYVSFCIIIFTAVNPSKLIFLQSIIIAPNTSHLTTAFSVFHF